MFVFVLQCLKQYVELLIKEGLETAISCPDSACPKRGHLQENEVGIKDEIRRFDSWTCRFPVLQVMFSCLSPSSSATDRVHGGHGDDAEI